MATGVIRKGIAPLRHSTVGVEKVVGRDKWGNQRRMTVCARLSIVMMDTAGNECDIPIVNGREFEQQSYEKYGKPHIVNQVKEGYIPKTDAQGNGLCPLTMRYSDAIGGPIIARPGEKECSSGDIGPHGCKHYLEVRDHRREANAKQVAQRRNLSSSMSEAKVKEMALGIQVALGLPRAEAEAATVVESAAPEPARPRPAAEKKTHRKTK